MMEDWRTKPEKKKFLKEYLKRLEMAIIRAKVAFDIPSLHERLEELGFELQKFLAYDQTLTLGLKNIPDRDLKDKNV